MNTDQTTHERQKFIAAAADSYTTPPPQSHAVLMPIRDSLATLRRKGASYRTIMGMLRKVEIRVSLDTLARFCREHVEQSRPRKEKRHSAAQPAVGRTDDTPPPAQPAPATPDIPASIQPPKEAGNTPAVRGKGPRIADPLSI